MADDLAETWNWAVEAGCKLYLWFSGYLIVFLTVMFGLRTVDIRNDGWLLAYLLFLGTFGYALHVYLWRTEGGMRKLVRISKSKRRLVKSR